MGDKSELLNRLKIDRSEEVSPKGISLVMVIILTLSSCAVGGIGSWMIFGRDKSQNIDSSVVTRGNDLNTAAKPVVTTTAVAPVPVASNRILDASGYITARRMATVSSEILGLITVVNVEEGMAVKAGQILAELDSSVAAVNLNYAKAQVAINKARLGKTKVNLAEAKRVLKRANELKVSNYSAEASVTKAWAEVESYEADLLSAQAEIDIAKYEVQRQQEHLDNHTIKAPFSGIVTVKNAQPGEIVSPSSAGGGFTRTGICTIVDMTSLEIEVDVNEAFIGQVFAGQKVEATLDAYPDWLIPAAVIAVIPTADRAKATVRVRIRIEEKDIRILPDMGVRVSFLKKT